MQTNVQAPTPHQRTMLNFATVLGGLQVYGGTVSPKTIARRRAANKMARASRRANRKGA